MRKLILIGSVLTIGVMFIAFPYSSRTTKTINTMESIETIKRVLDSFIIVKFKSGKELMLEKTPEGYNFDYNYFIDINDLSYNKNVLIDDLCSQKNLIEEFSSIVGKPKFKIDTHVELTSKLVDIFYVWEFTYEQIDKLYTKWYQS